MSFDRFLADLKSQAAKAGVSARAISEASPYLVYDQGIVNRDRGQRVFGQVFTEFAGRMAASYRMQQGQARIRTYAAAFARAEKEHFPLRQIAENLDREINHDRRDRH